MQIPELLKAYREKKIYVGDTVTLCGQLYYDLQKVVPPYYYCEEEKLFYRQNFLTIEEVNENNSRTGYYKNSIQKYLKDDIYYYDYKVNYLCPQITTDDLNDHDKSSFIHFLTFGMGGQINDGVTGCDANDIYGSRIIYRMTGRLMEPKNTDECHCELGIGYFKELSEVDPNYPDKVLSSLIISKYDPRPEIDLSIFPREIHEERIRDILAKTGMKRHHFHFILENPYEKPYQDLPNLWT